MRYEDFEEAEHVFDETIDRLQMWKNRFTAESKPEDLMPRRHRHNAIELNYISDGQITYLLGGAMFVMPTKRLVVFWGSLPHQIVRINSTGAFFSMHIPLAWFLAWSLPQEFVHRVLHGHVVTEPDLERSATDLSFFQQWTRDLDAPNPKPEVLLLEARARLHRLALSLDSEAVWTYEKADIDLASELSKVEQMAGYVAQHYTDEITVEDVAKHVSLHPKYATQIFHRRCGYSLKQYITTNRVHHAQRLLVTTDANILDVALHSGFGSASRFYAAFKAVCRQSPNTYREAMRAGKG